MAFKVDGTTIVNDSREVSNIIATTAEAQAGSINDKVMTPQRTKELIQGGTVSVIKSLQRIDFTLGQFNIGGTIQYLSMGASAGLVSGLGGADPSSGVTFSTPGDAANYCFFNFPSKNRYKTMLLIDHGGTSAKTGGNFFRSGANAAPAFENFSAQVRFTNAGGSITNTDIQVSHTAYIMWDSSTLTLEAPQVWIQMVEYY